MNFFTVTRVVPTFLILCSLINSPEQANAKGLFKKILSAAIKPQSILNCTPQRVIKVLNEKAIDNFYTVQKGKLYRSAQLTPDRLKFYIKKHNIKTIINLRGEHPELSWWKDEADIAQRNGIKFYNIPMSANELTPQYKLLQLLDIYDSAPTPILIHCRAGRDRTGEAAAIWVYEKMNGGNKKALKQLGLVPYQHSRILHPAKSFLIKIWNGRNWLMNEYDSTQYPEFKQSKPSTA